MELSGSETHDAFFKILSKKKPLYVCLVDGCPKTFQHDDKRTRHLIQVHQYPESFSFHQRRNQNKKKGKAGKENSGAKQERPEEPDVDAETLKKREARKRRRQQKKKKLLEQAKQEGSGMQVGEEFPVVIPTSNLRRVKSPMSTWLNWRKACVSFVFPRVFTSVASAESNSTPSA